MHNAPSVAYPVGRPLLVVLLAGSLWLAGLAVTLAWWATADPAGWRQVAAGLALVGSGGWALASWLRSPAGELRWDGLEWSGPRGGNALALDVALDLQQVLLVRFPASGSPGWLWLERRRCPQRWPDLRRAVYSRARPQAPPPGPPPASTS